MAHQCGIKRNKPTARVTTQFPQTLLVKMTHNSLGCFWRRALRPYFISGAEGRGRAPEAEKLTPEMIAAMKAYIYTTHNLDDFHEWVEGRQKTARYISLEVLRGVDQWREYFNGDEGEIVSAPTPGVIAICISFGVPIALVTIIVSAAVTGFGLWLKWIK